MREAEHRNGVRRDHAIPPQTTAANPLPVGEAGLETGRERGRGASTDEFPVQQNTPAHDMDPRTVPQPTGESTPEQRPGHAPQHRADEKAERKNEQHDTELFPGDTVHRLRTRWRELQADFVDDPQRAVRGADEVVDEVLRTITEHRQRLGGGGQAQTDTERLRLTMREYRAFVDRLLPTT